MVLVNIRGTQNQTSCQMKFHRTSIFQGVREKEFRRAFGINDFGGKFSKFQKR